MNSTHFPTVALIGNPNCGKTAVFNQLTGLNQKVSNYPGITVERKVGIGHFKDGSTYQIVDFPGTYSLIPDSMDEKIVTEQTMNWGLGIDRPDAIVSVVDSTNLRRNLLLVTQILDLGIPVIVALNMVDRLRHSISENLAEALTSEFGVHQVIPIVATKGRGIPDLQQAIQSGLSTDQSGSGPYLGLEKDVFQPVETWLMDEVGIDSNWSRSSALRLVCKNSFADSFHKALDRQPDEVDDVWNHFEELRSKAQAELPNWRSLPAGDTLERYSKIDALLDRIKWGFEDAHNRRSRSERVDAYITHPFFGPLIFVLMMAFIFQAIFSWAVIPMNWLTNLVDWLGLEIHHAMAAGPLRDLLTDGVLAGVGAIVVFLPQILILVFFLTLLEDSGYMARVAFMLDRFMSKLGLHGRSVLPLMSGYACAIPGIMATRTIESWKERLITILVLPLMSCSARLPVYALMIGAFVPDRKVWGIFGLQGITLVAMYFLGTITALIIARIFSRFIRTESTSSFVMEMPPYRIPMMRSVGRQVYIRGNLFLKNAGKIIMAVSIILWFMASFPKVDQPHKETANIEYSFAGRLGHAIEPVIKPLGFDWKIGIGLITSFAAREVLVSTLATIYNVEDTKDDVLDLRQTLRSDKDPVTGLPKYSILTALSLMVFFVYAAQCMATFAVVRHETNSWKWPLFMVTYLTGLAYIASFIVYQGGTLLGIGI